MFRVIVTERLLDTEHDNMWLKIVIDRTDHLHSRVGTRQSPQVTHTTDAHCKDEVDR
jgi:hypothetical protein